MSDPLPVPQAIALLQEYFLNAMEQKKLHSFYTCSGKCSDLPECERSEFTKCGTFLDGLLGVVLLVVAQPPQPAPFLGVVL